MPREYKGHYNRKHPPGTRVAPRLEIAVKAAAARGRISCKTANAIAGDLGVTPLEVGQAADILEVSISQCQLGLFSHADDKPDKSETSDTVEPHLMRSIVGALAENRMRCADAWRIADESGVNRREIGRACQIMNIKISRCQLGAF